MKKVFISYASEDAHVASQVLHHLRQSPEIDAWLDKAELRAGDTFLQTIADNLERAHFFVVLLSSTAVSKPWVHEEIRMALVREVNARAPRVLALHLDDVPVPVLLRHKTYIDARGRLDAALAELTHHLGDEPLPVLLPRQAVLAAMVDGPDDEWWSRVSPQLEASEGWSRREVAEAIRLLRETDLIVAVTLAWWCRRARAARVGGDVVNETMANEIVLRCPEVDLSEAAIRRSLARLEAEGFLLPAPARYPDEPAPKAWRPRGLLWVLLKSARRSGLFTPMLPPPVPERLSALLDFEGLASIKGKGWLARRLPDAFVAKTPDAEHVVHAFVAREAEPARTWLFRARDERKPIVLQQYSRIDKPTSLGEYEKLEASYAFHTEDVGFGLETFDDRGLLD